MAYTLDTYLKARETCRNKEDFGGRCYDFCPYRENGCCELSESELISLALEELLGEKIEFKSYEFPWKLLSIVEERRKNAKKQ